ncbi:MAG: hypothetical protein IPN98_10735 [Propionivibrio sp.]|nr:hypothetical protein [Propionivibrio sp.]
MLMIPAEAEHLIDRQPSGDLMRDEEHRHLPLELVDCLGEVLGRLLVEV